MDVNNLRFPDIDRLLKDGTGDHERIRAFRETLRPSEKDVFDKVFLLGFREGILLNLSDCLGLPLEEVSSPDLSRYVQLALTTYIKKPGCFGEYGDGKNCKLCPVRNQCLSS